MSGIIEMYRSTVDSKASDQSNLIRSKNFTRVWITLTSSRRQKKVSFKSRKSFQEEYQHLSLGGLYITRALEMELYQFSSQKVRDFAEDIDHAFVQRFGGGGYRDLDFKLFRRQIKKWSLLDGVTQEIYEALNSNLKHDNEDITWTELVEGVQDAEWALSLRCRQSHRFGSRTSTYNEGKFQVDQDGNVIVYTDGACLRNGQPGAQAGIGVWFDYDHPLNLSQPLNRIDPATNNVAEIKAVIEALKIVKFYGVEKLAIHTDSMYLINSVTNWIFTWISNDWRKRDGEPIIHRKQYRELLMVMEDMDIEWVYVEGHGNHEGNIEADHLARQGAQQY